jgi:hypothetical protein
MYAKESLMHRRKSLENKFMKSSNSPVTIEMQIKNDKEIIIFK